jgi:FkbM family methyltransferase
MRSAPGIVRGAATKSREAVWTLRRRASRQTLYVLSWISRTCFRLPYHEELFESLIFGGHLRGHYLAMPKVQVGAGFLLGTFERPVVRAMRTHVKPNSVAYDVGTSYGYHTLFLSRLVGPQGVVVGFEPHPRDYGLLVRNLEANKLRNVRPVQVAVTASSGWADFATFSYPGVSHILTERTPEDAKVVRVAAVSLDDFVFAQGYQAPDFIKIDVEGGEDGVLRGAERLLREHRPVIVAELSAVNSDAILSRMHALGYRSERLMGDDVLADVLFRPS